MEKITTRTSCRVCGFTQLTPLFSLGEQAVSDFVERTEVYSGVKCPIELERCGNCTLVQAKYTAPQELLYTRRYWYRSGVTQTMRDALKDIVKAAHKVVTIMPGDFVLDIGSNDGCLLRNYRCLEFQPISDPGETIIDSDGNWPGRYGPITVGVEPAVNLAEEGSKGVDLFINDFWSADTYFRAITEKFNAPRPDGFDFNIVLGAKDRAAALCGILTQRYDEGKAKVVTAIGMFYDLEEPNVFIGDIARVLAPEGVFIAQLMCLKQMLEKRDIGNLAHEHLLFYSLKSLDHLFSAHGLEIFDLEENNVNGGSYRLFIGHKGARPVTDRVRNARNAEEQLLNQESLTTCFQELDGSRKICVNFIKGEAAKGKKIFVFGASTKGNVILQYLGLDHNIIQGASDRSPEKWGKFTIETGIPIVSEDEARKANPDYFLVLPFAFLEEFIAREQEWLQKGGRFIVPLPVPRLVYLQDGQVVEQCL